MQAAKKPKRANAILMQLRHSVSTSSTRVEPLLDPSRCPQRKSSNVRRRIGYCTSHKNAAADDIQISMIPRETMFINNALVLLIFSAHTRGTHDVPRPKESGAVQTTLLVESEQPIRCRSEPLENHLMKPSRDLQTLVCVSVRIIVVVGEL